MLGNLSIMEVTGMGNWGHCMDFSDEFWSVLLFLQPSLVGGKGPLSFSKKVAPGLTTSSKKLLGARHRTTSNKKLCFCCPTPRTPAPQHICRQAPGNVWRRHDVPTNPTKSLKHWGLIFWATAGIWTMTASNSWQQSNTICENTGGDPC